MQCLELNMFVLIAIEQEDDYYKQLIDTRVLGIFKDEMIALREKNHIEKAIKKVWEKGEKDGQKKFLWKRIHPYWKYVRQLDPKFCPDSIITYRIISAPVITRL